MLHLILHIHFLLEVYSPIQQRMGLEESDNCNDKHDRRFEAEISQSHDTDLLILHLYKSRPDEHECPVEYVYEWDDKLVFEVIFEVIDVHGEDQVDI